MSGKGALSCQTNKKTRWFATQKDVAWVGRFASQKHAARVRFAARHKNHVEWVRRFASQKCQETPPIASSADLGYLAPPYILYIHRVCKVCRRVPRVRSAAELAGCKLWSAWRRLTFCTSIKKFTRRFPFGKVGRRYIGMSFIPGSSCKHLYAYVYEPS